MFASTRKLFIENVMASYDDFVKHYKTGKFGEDQLLRKAINSATALYHFREHLTEEHIITRQALEQEYSDYGLLGDFVNLSKHKSLDLGNPQITNSEQIFEQIEITEFVDEKGKYFYPQTEIVLILDNGTRRYLSEIIYNVFSFWCEKLSELEIVNIPKPPHFINNGFKPRKESEKKVNMELIKGESYKWKFQLFKWDDELDERKVKDLTNYDASLNIRGIPNKVTLGFTIEELDIEFDFIIELSEEQAIEYNKLNSDKARQELIHKLMETNINIQENLKMKFLEEISKKK